MEQRQEHQEAPNGRLEAERQGVFQNAFDAAANGIAIEDMDGRPLFANPALCHMLGFSEDEMRNKHCVEFSPPKTPNWIGRFSNSCARVRSTNIIWRSASTARTVPCSGGA